MFKRDKGSLKATEMPQNAWQGRQNIRTSLLIALLAVALTTIALFVYADNTECIIGCDSNEICKANCLNTEEYVVIENAGNYCKIICDTNQNCDDGNQNTADICNNGGTCQSSCINTETQPPCGIICSTDLECDDNDTNTMDVCENKGTCDSYCTSIQGIPKCTITCNNDAECNNNDANTAGRCENAGTCGAKCVNTKEEAEAYVVIENARKEAEADVVIENAYLPEGEMKTISARVEIRGLKEPFPEIDSRIDSYTADSPEDGNINTLVAAFYQELEFEEATITLPKTGPVNTIVKCQDFNFEMFECSHWEKTSIPFTETQDTITFAVNTFSAYAGALIKITKAAHLDQNREFISDIYEQVKEKDGVWSETIGVNEWIRISFEQPLGKTNDITVFARSLDGDARIEVYRQNGNELLAEISGINKESWYKTLLNGLDEDEKTAHFDLKVKDNNMQFDYIVDPAPNLDVNVTRVDGYDVSKAMPSFSYAIDGNLTIDFNVATDTNFGVTWADLNYSLTNTQGSGGTEIVKGLVVDGNKCQTNFIGDWNNQANSDVNLVGYWKFDSGASAWDFSGKGNTGTYYTTGVSSTAQGKWDTNAAYFQNSNDYVSIPSSSSLIFNNATNDLPFSISMWVNPTVSGVEQPFVSKYLTVNTDAEWNAQLLDNGKYYMQCLDSAAAQVRITITSSFIVNYNMWNHVVFTYDGSGSQNGMNIYVDGVLDTSPTRANNGYTKMDAYSAPVDIGVVNRASPPWDSWFNGWIEEVKIYNKVLTANDVSRDYALSARNFRTCSYDWNISGISDANYYANVLARDNASNSKFDPSDNSFHVNPSGAPQNLTNIDTSIWRVDKWDTSKTMPAFSYTTDGNLTIDFNFASDTNYGNQYADLNYSTSKTQGIGTSIINSLRVDGNRCQTNLIRDWNNFANSDANLVSYWKFDAQEDDYNISRAFDYSGKGNHGQYINGAANSAQGKWDTNAGFFDGTNDYVQVSDSSSLDLTNNFAISLWIKPGNLTQTNKYVLSKLGTGDNTYAIIWEYVGDNLEFYSSSYTGSNPRTGSQIPITNTNWHHVVYTYDGSTWAGYRDGENIFSLSTTFSLTASAENLLLGTFDGVGTCGGTGCSFGGLIEEAKIYNKALTANEVLRDYTLGIRNFRTCSYDWNISGIADANYYANVLVRDDAGNSDYNSSNNKFRVNPVGANTPPSLVIWQVDSHDFNAALPAFSYADDGNLTIKFRAADVNDNDLNFNMWYDTASGGKTNKLIGDINLSTETGHGSCDTNSKTGMVCNWDWNIFGISDSNYWIAIELNDGKDTNTMPSAKSFRVNPSTQNLTNLDTNIWRVDKWDTSKTMPAFSYTTDGNLTIDFNFASDTNVGNQYADLYYSTSKTQGTGTPIIDGLKVDGNRCQTNFIGDWNNQANSDANLVGYWKFDAQEDVNTIRVFDYSGKGNHGQYLLGAGTRAQGKWDTNAGLFAGAGDFVSVASSSSLTFNNATRDLPFSVSMWINPTVLGGVERALVGKYLNATTPFDAEWNTQLLDNGAYYMQCLEDVAYKRIKITSSFTAKLNVWSHVVFTYDGSGSHTGLNIYVNGVQDASPTRANDNDYTKMDSYSAPVDIAAISRILGNVSSWNGLIEEVKIYDKALTANEISRDYALSVRNFRTCSYDWNISGIADANYYANVLVRDDAGNSKYNSSNNNFRVNPSAPAAPPTVGQLRICDGTCALSKTMDPQTAFTVEAAITDPDGYNDINTQSIKLELYSFYDRNGCTENWDCNRLAMRDDNISLGTRNGCTHSPSTNVYCINVPVSAWSTKFLNGDTNIYVRVDDNDTAGLNTHRMDANWLRDHNTLTVNANLSRSEDTTSGTYSGAPATTYNAFDSGQTVNAYIKTTHSGNVTMDVNLTGTDLNISSTVFIGDGNETWNIANATAGSTPITPFVAAAIPDWNRGSYPDSNTQNIWYWLSMPDQQPTGPYTGTITYSSGSST